MFPHRSPTLDRANRRYSWRAKDGLTKATRRTSLTDQTSLEDPTANERTSSSSTWSKCLSDNVCRTYLDESIRVDLRTRQKIDLSLLYAYDSSQAEVGNPIDHFKRVLI